MGEQMSYDYESREGKTLIRGTKGVKSEVFEFGQGDGLHQHEGVRHLPDGSKDVFSTWRPDAQKQKLRTPDDLNP